MEGSGPVEWYDVKPRPGVRPEATKAEGGPVSPMGREGSDIQLEEMSSFIANKDSVSVKAQGLGLPDVKWED